MGSSGGPIGVADGQQQELLTVPVNTRHAAPPIVKNQHERALEDVHLWRAACGQRSPPYTMAHERTDPCGV